MRLLSIYKPRLLRPTFFAVKAYYSAEYSGGKGLARIEKISVKPPKKPEPPLGHLDSVHITNPRTIVEHLNEYVIGQDKAKKTLAVAIFNHYNRVNANMNREYMMEHEQMYTETHHFSNQEDSYYVHSMPTVESQRRAWLNPPTEGHASDGHKVLQNETKSRSVLEFADKDATVHDKSNVLLIGPTGSGKTLLAKTLANALQVPFSMSDATSFTQAGYVGEDVELVIQRLLQASDFDVKKAETGIVFIDEIDKISRRSDSHTASRDVSGEGVQQSLLRILEGTIVNVTDKTGANSPKRGPPSIGSGQKGDNYTVDTSNILFILSGAFIGLDKVVGDRMARGSIGFDANLKNAEKEETANVLDKVEPFDLIKYGFIPEFIGRIPVISSVNNLEVGDMVRVLKEPKNSLLKQYERLFELSKVQLRFSQNALKAIATLALEKKTGARGLRRIMENVLLDPMYDAPGSNIKQVVIDSKVIYKKKSPVYITTEKSAFADKMLADDDRIELSEDDTQKIMTQI